MDFKLLVIIIIPFCAGSLYDPHLFPNKGPFFEGWYMRFIDSNKNLSFGVLFGKVLPENEQLASKTWFMGMIIDGADNGTAGGKLKDYNCFPTPSLASLTVNGGQPISKDPDYSSPAHFEFETDSCGYVRVGPSQTEVNVRIGNVRVTAEIGEARHWASDGRGPMGWLNNLPLPLAWFVYSVGSQSKYRLTLDDGQKISGTALVHMEKNWGGSFPPSWIWLQGISSPQNTHQLNPTDPTQSESGRNKKFPNDNFVSFAVTYGPVGFYVVNVPSHLAGFRHAAKDISIDFRPDNSISSVTRDACKGQIALTLTSIKYKMEVITSADRSTFSECFYGPMQNGFRQVCKESFQATAVVNIYQRNWFSWKMIDSETFKLSALEFGGAFTCDGACVNAG